MRKLFARLLNPGANSTVDTSIHPMLLMTAPLSNLDPNGWIRPAALREGTDSLQIDEQNHSEFAQAEEQFRRDLPHLLEQSEKLGRWVLYSAQGPVEEAANEDGFYQKYGKQIGTKFFLARVQPEPPDAEVTPNWFVSVQKTGASQGPKLGR